jgi:membrane-bound lytic murein transglycosylase MltF
MNSRARTSLAAAVAAAALLVAGPAAHAQAGAAASGAEPGAERELSVRSQARLEDFDRMLERRVVRVLAPYSRSLYFIDKGHERGTVADLVRDFERHLNQKYATELRKRPLTVLIIATPRDRLFDDLNKGRGDIAAGNLTVTPAREKLADFVAPRDRTPVREIVVTGPKSPALATVEELGGRTIHVRRSSSYRESLDALNARLLAAGKAPVAPLDMPEALADEDALEMLNAGLVEWVVADDWKARLWAQVLPRIKPREDLVLRTEGYTGWAIRKGSPRLAAEIEDFYAKVVQKQGGIDKRIAAYHRRFKQIVSNTGAQELKRFQQTAELFRKYGEKYDFDPLMLAAQGFQESRLDQGARSPVGAIGVMQVMPATGAELAVGDISVTEPNIHAGTKYMDLLMDKYLAGAQFTQQDRTLFAFAAYNCGPGNVARMRKEAEKRGLDPNRWFDNVEIVVAEKIGTETTTYVRNIYKYYVAYRLIAAEREAAESARQKVAPGKR